jgi:uncharacterized protein YnzC (UPF0291/DUF896 family)
MEVSKKRKFSKKSSPEEILKVMNIAKGLMDIKHFDSYCLVSKAKFTRWNTMRVYLLDRLFIEKQHLSYIWIGQEPTIELAIKFVEFEYSFLEEKKNLRIKKKLKQEEIQVSDESQVSESSNLNTIYEDNLKLKKQNQELTAQNGKMYNELRDVIKDRNEYREKYLKDIDRCEYFKLKSDYEKLEKKFKSEQDWGWRSRNESTVLAGENASLITKIEELESKSKKPTLNKEERQMAIDVGLRMRNIELHPELLRKAIEVFELVDRKGLDANIKDIVELDREK